MTGCRHLPSDFRLPSDGAKWWEGVDGLLRPSHIMDSIRGTVCIKRSTASPTVEHVIFAEQ